MRSRFVAAHCVAVLLHVGCALYAFSTPHAYTTQIPCYLERVRYGGGEGGVYYYEKEEVLSTPLPSVILLHGVVALVTTAFHLFVYIPAHAYHSQLIWSQGYFPVRWLEYSITCTLMTMSTFASAGTDDLTVVWAAIFYGVALQCMGCAIEQRKETIHFFLFVGGGIQLGMTISTLWYIVSSPRVTAPHVLEYVSYVFYYACFPVNSYLDAVRREGNFVRTDWLYIVLSLSSKVGLFWLQVGEVERSVSYSSTPWWPDVQIFGLGIVLPLLILVVGVSLAPPAPPVPSSSSDPPPLASSLSSLDPPSLLARVCTFRVLPPLRVLTVTKVERPPRLPPPRLPIWSAR